MLMEVAGIADPCRDSVDETYARLIDSALLERIISVPSLM